MQVLKRSLALTLTLFTAVCLAAPEARAQGVTGSAIRGTVTREGGGPVVGAIVKLTNAATGASFSATTGPSGEYFIDNVPPADTYVLTATSTDFEARPRADIALALGERVNFDIVMRAAAGEEIAVVARVDSNNDKSRTGASTRLQQTTINQLPLQGRNFTDLTSIDPRVSGSSFAGQNNRYNNIQIDGGANNDLFGLAANGTPGGQANAKPLSLEAIKEFVIQIAPFDVRQGSFAGGLVNAITKSGTNDFHGTVFGYIQNKGLTRVYDHAIDADHPYADTQYTYADYSVYQYGLTFSGPIIKDKLHFFIATDLQAKSQSFASPFNLTGNDMVDKTTTGFTVADVTRFQSILAKYGINNPGDGSAPSQGSPDHNLFVKVTSGAIENTNLELSYNFVSANADILLRAPTSPGNQLPTFSTARLRDGYQLSNSGYSQTNNTNTVRVKATTNFDGGNLSNEFLGGVSIIRDARSIPNNSPLIIVDAGKIGSSDSWMAAGGERFSQANSLDQNVYTLQDNLTWAFDKHRLTVGTSNEFLHFNNVFLQAATGVWAFGSLDAFDAGTALAFQRRLGVTDQQGAGVANFNVSQLGLYVQDEWSLLDNFSLTPGVRLDLPILGSAVTNPALLNAGVPIDTSKVPTGNLLWSPRLGFNWDPQRNSETIVRGGVGIFSGRPPYVWISNAYAGNGLSQIQLTCAGATGVPAFTGNPAAQPTSCNGGTGKPTPPVNQGEIDYFDPNTKYPQNLRFALGADRRLPFDLLASVDFLYTLDVNGWYTTDANLNNLGTDGDGRSVYGTFATATGATTPSRIDGKNLTQAVKVFNLGGGHVGSATFQLQKPVTRHLGVSVAYAYTRSYDRISLTSSQAFSNFQFAPVDGSLEGRNLRPSAFDRPHKITATVTAELPLGFGVGASYVGQSGTPYTWIVGGDANGDGVSGNDQPFIPANPSQITLKDPTQWAALQQFIKGQSCLADAQGTLLRRGACRNPWQDFLDARLSWATPKSWTAVRGEVQWDIFNVLNLLNPGWGHILSVTQFETAPSGFLSVAGYDPANKRPVYSFKAPSTIVAPLYGPTASRWRMQFGGRVFF